MGSYQLVPENDKQVEKFEPNDGFDGKYGFLTMKSMLQIKPKYTKQTASESSLCGVDSKSSTISIITLFLFGFSECAAWQPEPLGSGPSGLTSKLNFQFHMR